MEQQHNLDIPQRWLIRASWPKLEPLVSHKGFLALQTLKKDIGAPVANRDDHHDWDYTAKEKMNDELRNQRSVEALSLEIDPTHLLTAIFYNHLFENNPSMTEIFWRFNLYQSMDKIVSVLDPISDLQSSLRALGERHRGRGILNDDYDRIGVSFRYALNQLVPETIPQKAADAWVAAWGVFAHAMKVPDLTPDQQETENEKEEDKQQREQEYSLEEVQKHDKPEDLWIIIAGKVYDLTAFLPIHPGGQMLLLGAGKDATQLFTANFHSPRAQAILSKYQIGKVAHNN